MQSRLQTSEKAQEILEKLSLNTRLTPNYLARLAFSVSVILDDSIEEYESDTNGREFNRVTLTGQYDLIYKAMIAQSLGKKISDEEYFPTLLKKHIDRGAEILKHEYDYAGNTEKFITSLSKKEMEMLR